MQLDVRTLLFSLAVSFILQSVIFYLLSLSIKRYDGVKNWTLGGICFSLGFTTILLRSNSNVQGLLVMLSNIFLVGGLILFYTGSQHFLNLKRKNKYLYWSFAAYLLVIAYFTFIKDQLNTRIVIFSIGSIPFFLINGIIFLRHEMNSIKSSSLLLASLFFIHAFLYAVRGAYYTVNQNIDSMFSGGTMQMLTFLVPLTFGLLWTYGFLLAVNQRLNGELAKKSNDLEKINAEKDKFFSIIGHDLRDPLSSVIGLSELMSDKNQQFSSEELIEMAASIHHSALSTNGLLEDLLEWSGSHKGSKSFSPVRIIFGKEMGGCITNLEASAQAKKITFKNTIPSDLEVNADLRMLQSIVRNLVVNATKFTPEGGQVQLSVKSLDGKLQFSVSDNGIGMNKKLLDSLFKIGIKNNRKGTNGEASSGLGLILCRDFVEKHGGEIWAQSEEGKGSTFFFTITQNPSSYYENNNSPSQLAAVKTESF